MLTVKNIHLTIIEYRQEFIMCDDFLINVSLFTELFLFYEIEKCIFTSNKWYIFDFHVKSQNVIPNNPYFKCIHNLPVFINICTKVDKMLAVTLN